MTWEGEMTKMKAVNLKKLYNFVVENLFWNHLSKKNMFEFWWHLNLNFLNDLWWINNQNEVLDLKKL
jgi:hypothetical protein